MITVRRELLPHMHEMGRLVRINFDLLPSRARRKIKDRHRYVYEDDAGQSNWLFGFVENEGEHNAHVTITAAEVSCFSYHDGYLGGRPEKKPDKKQGVWKTWERRDGKYENLEFYGFNHNEEVTWEHIPTIACAAVEFRIRVPVDPQKTLQPEDKVERQMMYAPGLPTIKGDPIVQADTDGDAEFRHNKVCLDRFDPSNDGVMHQAGYGILARPPKEGESPNLVASVAVGSEVHDPKGVHYPCIDIDYGAKLVPTQTKGHYHLYLNRPVAWQSYVRLLNVLAECGLIETGYADASIVKGFTSLRPPMSHVAALIARRAKDGLPTDLSDIEHDLTVIGEDSVGTVIVKPDAKRPFDDDDDGYLGGY